VFRVRGGEHAEARKANADNWPSSPGVRRVAEGVSGIKTTTILIGLAGLMVTAVVAAEVQNYATAATSDQSAAAVVDAQGNLRVPEDYRIAYQLLGAWAIAADQGAGSKELHVVYASPGTIAAYRKDAHFPDGSVLVKEVFATDTQPMTTGTVSHAQTLKGWFVMVRDSRDTHPGNKLWGDGWGWSWFDAGNPSKTTSTDFKVNCLGCHVPAQATEWIYVNGYPPLKG
jgi:Cytochrome P460